MKLPLWRLRLVRKPPGSGNRKKHRLPFLEALFDHLPLAAAIVDEQDRILAINPAFTQLFGYSAAEAQGQPIGDLIVPEELRAEGAHFTEAALTGEPINTETVRQTRDGTRIPVWLRAISITFRGRRIGVLALYQDIRPIQEYRQHLLQLIEELEQLNAAKDRLLATISHDLRTPLATAQGLTNLILAEAHSPEVVLDTATKLQQLLNEQLQLVNELLEFARAQTAIPQKLEREELDLCEILVHVIDSLTLAAYSKQLRILPQLPDQELPLVGDRSKLQRVFQNLLSNAIKFTPEGGMVEVHAWQEPDTPRPIVVRIRDTGIGIPPEQLPTLFTPFSPGQRSGTGGERGTGLGLAIVKRFVELHGGEITVDSTPGQGTTFVIRLPRTPPQEPNP